MFGFTAETCDVSVGWCSHNCGFKTLINFEFLYFYSRWLVVLFRLYKRHPIMILSVSHRTYLRHRSFPEVCICRQLTGFQFICRICLEVFACSGVINPFLSDCCWLVAVLSSASVPCVSKNIMKGWRQCR